MRRDQFLAVVRDRGPEIDLWVVYEEDRHESVLSDEVSLALRRAFWKRGEAYAYAARAHGEREWRRYYVFRISVNEAWASSDVARPLEFEAAFDEAHAVPRLSITAGDLAAVVDG